MDLLASAPFIRTYGPYILVFILAYFAVIFVKEYRDNQNIHKTKNVKEHKDNCDLLAHEEDAVMMPYNPKTYSDTEMIARSKEFYYMMNQRRSIRFFSKKSIPKEVVENIIKTAGTSPSGAHMQPWTFVAVWNQDIKDKIRAIIEEEEKINYDKRMGATWVEDLKRLGTTWKKPYLSEAPCLIVFFKQTYGLKEDGSRITHYYHDISSSISIGILLSAIQCAGLVTLTSTPLNAGSQLRLLLDRPINEKNTLVLPIGYAADDCKVPYLVRKPLRDIMVEKE